MEQQSRKRKRNRIAGKFFSWFVENYKLTPTFQATLDMLHKEEDTTDRKKARQDPSASVSSSPTKVVQQNSQTKEGGQVLVLGQGDVGQLGLGEDMVERKRPYPLKSLEGHRVVQVVCGGMHTAALTEEGKVFTWGCNDECALGRTVKEEGEEFVPGEVKELENKGVVQLSAGDSHTAALLDNGDVYAWGVFRDSSGPFGLVEPLVPSATPTRIITSDGAKIASGSDHIVILTRKHDILTLGCAEQGQLGRICEVFCHRGGRQGIQVLITPKVVRFQKPKPKFVDIFCGSYHTFARTTDDWVYGWGLNNYGQLGTGDSENRFQPQKLQKKWLEGGSGDYANLGVAGGLHHTVVCNNGDLFVMGRTEYGRLGLGAEVTDEVLTPRKVSGISAIKMVAAGSACSFAVDSSGGVYSWGMGTNLQLGTGEEEEDIWKPTKVGGKNLEGKRVLAASLGGQHTALLITSNTTNPQ